MSSEELEHAVIVGAGPVGRAVAEQLIGRGHLPTIVTRSGTTVVGANDRVANVADPALAKEALADATAVFQCGQPPYHRWPAEFRPFQESVLSGCEASGALLVAVENVYGYGPVTEPMTESTSLISSGGSHKGRVRAEAWRDLEHAHTSGRVRCAAVRASDLIGAHVEESVFGERFFRPLLAGKPAQLLGPPDVRHTATNVDDLAAAMVAVAERPETWGRPWHAPNAPAATFAEIVGLAARALEVEPKSRTMPSWVLRAVGLFNKGAGETVEMLYQFERDFIVDSSDSERALDLEATPLHRSVDQAVAWYTADAAEAGDRR